ncbi:MAG: RluA family pseudouridine synthase [Treponema sp.]|nr:RluA family pseudouridine synthase [Treponema sp.]
MEQIQILFENDEILVVNKPAGLAVQGGENISHSLDKDFSQALGYKIYLVHRLDKDTAGLMVVAKSSKAAGKWTNLIGSKVVKKEYIAVCVGSLKQKKGVIDESLLQHGEARNAVTHYKVEEERQIELSTGPVNFSKVRLVLETGRMHQIRIHLSKQGCPIAQDDQHGNFKVNKLLKKELKMKKMLLASVKLTIPLNGKDVSFEIPLPEHFAPFN